jgi:hypothetical protein
MQQPPSEGSEGVSGNPRGRILTFYSYKGGTGRSMALANVAWMLALNNKRVLVIDWDLEAPGVHRYFHPFLEDKELRSSRGLIDFVEDLAARQAASSEPLADEEGDISSFVVSLDREGWDWARFGDRAGIDLLPAGQQSHGYSTKVNEFNWIAFYQKLGGRRFLAYMAAQVREVLRLHPRRQPDRRQRHIGNLYCGVAGHPGGLLHPQRAKYQGRREYLRIGDESAD